MAFPSSPSNGQRATVNDIIYEYNSTKGAWLRVSAQGFTSANLTVGGLITDNYYRADGTSLLGVNKSVYNGTATASTSVTLIDSVPSSGNTSVNWTLTSKDLDNTTYKNSVVSSLNDGTNVYYSEYGIILSNASVSVSTFTSNIVSGNIRLYAVGDSANVNITFQRTLLGTSTDVGYLTAGARGLQGPTGNVSYGNTEVAAYLTDYTGNIGNVKTTANVITTEYFIGNGSQLTGLPSSYGNTEVASYLPTYSGNVSAAYFIGNGSQLTGIVTDATRIQSGTSNVRAFSSGNVTVSVAGTANAAVFTTSNIIVSGVSTSGLILSTKSGSAIRAENGSIYAGQNGTFVNAVLTNTINAYTGSNIGLNSIYNFNDVKNIWAANVYVTTDVTVGQNLTVTGEINTSKTVTALNILNPFLLAGM